MPNEGMKISQLPAATEVLDSDVLVGVGGGVTRKFTFATIASYISTKLTALFAAKQDKITANGVLQGDGDGGVTAKTLDTSALTNDNNHIPTSGVVKSAIDAVTSQTVGHATAEDPTILSGSGSNVLNVQLPAGIYLVTARLVVPNNYSGWLQINLFVGDGIGSIGNGSCDITSAGVAKTIGACGVVKLTAALTSISVFTIGYGAGVIDGTSVTMDYYKLN